MRKIEILPYDKNWKVQYEKEKTLLLNIFKNSINHIYHIGSTSIPNLAAKPVIDILIDTYSISNIDNFNQEMIKAGYEPLGEYGIKNRRFFLKGGDNRTHHVHIFQKNDHNIIRHLAFRDYLNHNKKRLKEYEELKIKLAIKYPYDINGYCEGKNNLIKEIEKEAVIWYNK